MQENMFVIFQIVEVSRVIEVESIFFEIFLRLLAWINFKAHYMSFSRPCCLKSLVCVKDLYLTCISELKEDRNAAENYSITMISDTYDC